MIRIATYPSVSANVVPRLLAVPTSPGWHTCRLEHVVSAARSAEVDGQVRARRVRSIEPQGAEAVFDRGDGGRERRQLLWRDPFEQGGLIELLDLGEVVLPQPASPSLEPRERKFRVDRLAQLGWVEVPAGVDQVEPKVEQVARLRALDKCAELLGDEFRLRQRRDDEWFEAEIGDVEEGVATRTLTSIFAVPASVSESKRS